MPYLRRFILMLQFMTAIPIRADIKTDREDFGKGLVTAPLVGLVIGMLLAGGNYLLGLLFPPLVTAVLTIMFYIILTGGLHFDGLGDTADGLFSNRPRERMLEIMKDSRVGTNAVLILIIVVLLDISILSSIHNQALFILLFLPVAGRIASLVGAGSSKYAGVSDGPGRWCIEYCSSKDVLSGLVIYFIIFAAAVWVSGLFAQVTGFFSVIGILLTALIPPLSAFFLTKFFGNKLGGATGDILGAVCELNQVVFLLSAFLLIH